MSQTALWTYEDAVDFLLDFTGNSRPDTDNATIRTIRNCVSEAMRALHHRNSAGWSIYRNRSILQTVAPYSTGTIQYDYATRTVTLTDGTFPTWAPLAKIRFTGDNIAYTIASRTDATHLVLAVRSAPAEDITAGTTFQIFRDTYFLPIDFRTMEKMLDVQNRTDFPLLERFNSVHDNYQVPGEPRYGVIQGDQDYLGSLGIVLVPSPATARSYEILYSRAPRQLKFDRIIQTSCSAVGTAVTGVNFPIGCEGCVIRFSSNTTTPTASSGSNPYYDQRVIVSRTDATHAVIDQALDNNLSNVAAVVSDPLDLEYNVMIGAFRSLAKLEYAKLGDRKDLGTWDTFSRKDIEYAIEADEKLPPYTNSDNLFNITYFPASPASIT